MKTYLEEMTKKGLIEAGMSENGQRIRITKSGVEFIMKYSQMKDLERTFGL